MSDEIYLTKEGAERLKAELSELTGPARKALAKRLRDAIQQGDLSENADYKKAKEDQGFLEGRIQELEYILSKAIIIVEDQGEKDVVSIGDRVTVQEEGFPSETYQIVGAKEADPRKGKISNESPIGSALIDHHVNDFIEVDAPSGKLRFKIIKIE